MSLLCFRMGRLARGRRRPQPEAVEPAMMLVRAEVSFAHGPYRRLPAAGSARGRRTAGGPLSRARPSGGSSRPSSKLHHRHALLSQSGYFKERSLPRREKSGSGARGRASQILVRGPVSRAPPAISVPVRSAARDRFRRIGHFYPATSRAGRQATPFPGPAYVLVQHAPPVVAAGEPLDGTSPGAGYADPHRRRRLLPTQSPS